MSFPDWATTPEGKAYVGVLSMFGVSLAVSLVVPRWFTGLELFTSGSGTDDFFRGWLPGLITFLLGAWCFLLGVGLVVYALIGWRRFD